MKLLRVHSGLIDLGSFLDVQRHGHKKIYHDGELWNIFIPIVLNPELTMFTGCQPWKCAMAYIFSGFSDYTVQASGQWSCLLMAGILCILRTEKTYERINMVITLIQTLVLIRSSYAKENEKMLVTTMEEFPIDYDLMDHLINLASTSVGWEIVEKAFTPRAFENENDLAMLTLSWAARRHVRKFLSTSAHYRAKQYPKVPTDTPSTALRLIHTADAQYKSSKTFRVDNITSKNDSTGRKMTIAINHPTEGERFLTIKTWVGDTVTINGTVYSFSGSIGARIFEEGDSQQLIIDHTLSLRSKAAQSLIVPATDDELAESSFFDRVMAVFTNLGHGTSTESKVINGMLESAASGGTIVPWQQVICDTGCDTGINLATVHQLLRLIYILQTHRKKDSECVYPLFKKRLFDSRSSVVLLASEQMCRSHFTVESTMRELCSADHALLCIAFITSLEGASGSIREQLNAERRSKWWRDCLGYFSSEVVRYITGRVEAMVRGEQNVRKSALLAAENALGRDQRREGIIQRFFSTHTKSIVPVTASLMRAPFDSPLPREFCVGCKTKFGYGPDSDRERHAVFEEASEYSSGKERICGVKKCIMALREVCKLLSVRMFRIDDKSFYRTLENVKMYRGIDCTCNDSFTFEEFSAIYYERALARERNEHFKAMVHANVYVPRLHVAAKEVFLRTSSVELFADELMRELRKHSDMASLNAIRGNLQEMYKDMQTARCK